MCNDALDNEPGCVELRVIRARAHIGLRRDLDAQADLRELIRMDPQCGIAYRLLGELAARRDENESAAIFFREAIRLDPDDHEARDWLAIVDVSLRPAAVANHLPAPATAAGRFPATRAPVERGLSSAGSGSAYRTLSAPARTPRRPGTQPRFARGTHAPAEQDERPTTPFGLGSAHSGEIFMTPAPEPREPTIELAQDREESVGSRIPPTPLSITIPGRPPTVAPAKPTKVAAPRPLMRGPTPELPGFGDYLVSSGIISRDRLRAAQAYQRSMRVHLSTAIVTLGLATPQRIEWAAVAHQSQLARDRHQP